MMRRILTGRGKDRIRFLCVVFFGVWLCSASGGSATLADGWPTYRGNITRSGVSDEDLGTQLYLQWKYDIGYKPKPVWPIPAEELPRMHYDSRPYVVGVDGRIYFASAIKNKVSCLDAASCALKWEFYAEGPIRFAPSIYEDKVYFGSDDGYVYCVGAENGELIWRYRAGPTGEKIIGNERMISLWPIRTSVLADKGEVYFAAGVFPYEGVYVCALKADTGEIVWRNDTVSDHVIELMYGGVSPHGYLVASDKIIYVPSGRMMPVTFNRKTGEFIEALLISGGGTWAVLDNNRLIAGVEMASKPRKVAYDEASGAKDRYAFAWFAGIDMAVTGEGFYILTPDGIYCLDRVKYTRLAKAGSKLLTEQRELKNENHKLGKTLKDADEQTKAQIEKQIQENNSKIEGLALEEKKLKDVSYKWHWPKKGLRVSIKAGGLLFCGGDGQVVAVDAEKAEQVWSTEVKGKVAGLSVCEGRLFVSTDDGLIYCFGKEEVSQPKNIAKKIEAEPYPEDKLSELYKSAAEKILKESGIKKGYCLVLDCGQGRLAYELAKRSELQIIGIEKDIQKVEIARGKLDAAGMLGSRVVVEPWGIGDLPDYFANLIVSDGMLRTGETASARKEIDRVLRPYGGVCLLGKKKFFGSKVSWKKTVRGKLDGAGSWTHLYGNVQNTACSGDQLVKGPLGVLWFGEPGGGKTVDNHGRSPAPLSMNGRLFIPGVEAILAYDAYNGSFLWQQQVPGAIRIRADVDSSNVALSEEALYVAALDKCYRLDVVSGEIVRTYSLPGDRGEKGTRWGYIGCSDNILFGSSAQPLKFDYISSFNRRGELTEKQAQEYQREGNLWDRLGDHWELYPYWGKQGKPQVKLDKMLTSDAVFAIDADSGELLWEYRGKDIPQISISVGDGKMFFVESAGDSDRIQAFSAKKELIKKGVYIETDSGQIAQNDADVRVAVAVDVKTGEILWKKAFDLTGCGGDKMGIIYADGLILFLGHFSNHDRRPFLANELRWRRITAVSAATGEVVWSRPLNYLRRPLVMGDKIIIEPRACELRTGDIVMRKHPITGKDVPWEFLRPGHSCGIVSASADTMFYRSAWVAIYDFTADDGLGFLGGIRPGCWLNVITANGLMLMPESGTGCICGYPLRCSVVMVRKKQRASGSWKVFITHGDMTPAKHFAINFGAPGDMKDDRGRVWFAYPNAATDKLDSYPIHYPGYGVKFDLTEEILPSMGYYCRDFRSNRIAGTDKPWLFASGCAGLVRCEIPLIDDGTGQKPEDYTVRMGFAAPAGDKSGQRVFDIKLQGKVVAKDFDIVSAAGKTNKAVVKQFKNIRVENNLVVELVPKTTNPKANNSPVINFIEVVKK